MSWPGSNEQSDGGNSRNANRLGLARPIQIFEWKTYSEMRPEYEEQFRRWTVHLSPQDWPGKTFLDVGWGMGRNSYWPLSYGATSGVSIDVDQNSLAAARQTLAPFPNGTVRKVNPCEMSFKIFSRLRAFDRRLYPLFEFPEASRSPDGEGDETGRARQ